MFKRDRNGIKVFIIVLAALVIVACSSNEVSQTEDNPSTEQQQQNPQNTSGGDQSITIGITRGPASFNPLDRPDWPSFRITSVMFPPLIELNNDLEFVPMLASSIETDDFQTYTVHLNQEATWTDGTPVTADDVLFSLEMATHPNVPVFLASQYALLEGVGADGNREQSDFSAFPGAKKIDDHTIQFVTKNPVAELTFNDKVASILRAIPKHVLGDVAPENLNQHPFMLEPTVSYGAFKFVRYQRDQYVELEANPDYFKGAPKLDKLFFKIVDPSSLVAQLESGDIDMNHPDIGLIPYQDHERLEGLEHLTVEYGGPINYKFIGIQTQKVAEKKLRQAMAYGINRQLIVDNLLRGKGEVANGPYAPISPYYDESVRDYYPYDPEKAKELLAQIGWDGSRTLELLVPTGQGLEDAANIIVENLRSIGITVNQVSVDMPTSIQLQVSGEYELALGNLAFQYEPDQSNFLKTGASNNFPFYSNAHLDELFDKGAKAVDPEERKVYYNEYQHIYMTDLPHIPLYFDYRMMAVSKRVTKGKPADIGMLIDVHEWDVE